MNSSKIACDIRFNHLSIAQIAEKYNISKAEVVKLILSFFASFPNSTHTPAIRNRFKAELTKEFLASNSSSADFAEEHGISASAFRNIMREVIEDYHLIKSDAVAMNLFQKTFDGVAVISKYVPKRIVKQIAVTYANAKHISQYDLASMYGIRRSVISSLLKRAIAENLIDDVTADKIFVFVRGYSKAVDGYSKAFDQRERLKTKQV